MSDRDEWFGMTDDNIAVWMDLFHLEQLGLVRIEHDEFGLMTVVPATDELNYDNCECGASMPDTHAPNCEDGDNPFLL